MPLDGTSYQDEVTLGLINARHYVELGWCQRSEKNGAGEFCAFGAIFEATRGQDGNLKLKAMRRFASVLPEFCDDYYKHRIICWNDSKGRTKEEVLAKFDEAIG